MQQPMIDDEGKQAGRLSLDSLRVDTAHPSYFKRILTIFKVVIGLALFIISVRGIQWTNLVAGIRTADPSWLLLAVFSVLLGLALKLCRWAIFVRNYRLKPSWSKLFSSYFVGQAANIVFPFRSGELARVAYFSRDPQILPEIVSTIALEKYFDFLALTMAALLVSVKFSLDNLLNLRGIFLPLAIMLTIAFFGVLLFGPSLWKKIRAGRLPKHFGSWMDKWVEVNQWLRQPRKMLPGILLTILIWVVMWLTNLLLFQTLHMLLSATAAGLVLISVYVGLLPALMPGNIGPFYFFASLALLPFGIIHAQAVTYAVILHAIVTLPPLIGGVIGLSVRLPQEIAS